MTVCRDQVGAHRVGDVRRSAARERLRDALRADGVAVFSGVDDPAELTRLAATVLRVVPHPHGDRQGLTTLTDLGRVGDRANRAGFGRRPLLPHTDRSGIPHPPALLIAVLARRSTGGGASVLVDGRAVHDDLARTEPGALADLLRPGTVLFGGPSGHLGAVFTDVVAPAGGPATMDRRVVRLRLDPLAEFAPDVAARIPALRAAIHRHTRTVALEEGEGYVLDNHRWLHGRTGYTGSRTLHRLLGVPLPGLGLRPGFSPAGGR